MFNVGFAVWLAAEVLCWQCAVYVEKVRSDSEIRAAKTERIVELSCRPSSTDISINHLKLVDYKFASSGQDHPNNTNWTKIYTVVEQVRPCTTFAKTSWGSREWVASDSSQRVHWEWFQDEHGWWSGDWFKKEDLDSTWKWNQAQTLLGPDEQKNKEEAAKCQNNLCACKQDQALSAKGFPHFASFHSFSSFIKHARRCIFQCFHNRCCSSLKMWRGSCHNYQCQDLWDILPRFAW